MLYGINITDSTPVTEKISHGYTPPSSITAKMQKNDASAAIVKSSVSINEPIKSNATPIAERMAPSVSFLVLYDIPLLIIIP